MVRFLLGKGAAVDAADKVKRQGTGGSGQMYHSKEGRARATLLVRVGYPLYQVASSAQTSAASRACGGL